MEKPCIDSYDSDTSAMRDVSKDKTKTQDDDAAAIARVSDAVGKFSRRRPASISLHSAFKAAGSSPSSFRRGDVRVAGSARSVPCSQGP